MTDEVFSILLHRRPSSVPYFTSEVSGMEWLNIYGHVQFRIKKCLNSGYFTSDSLLTSATFTHNFLRSWTQLKPNCSLLQTTVFLLYLIPHEPKELSDQTNRRRHKIHQLTARTKLARRAPTWFIPRKMYSTACFQIFQCLSHSMRNEEPLASTAARAFPPKLGTTGGSTAVRLSPPPPSQPSFYID